MARRVGAARARARWRRARARASAVPLLALEGWRAQTWVVTCARGTSWHEGEKRRGDLLVLRDHRTHGELPPSLIGLHPWRARSR